VLFTARSVLWRLLNDLERSIITVGDEVSSLDAGSDEAARATRLR
jgi:hypothetical protein